MDAGAIKIGDVAFTFSKNIRVPKVYDWLVEDIIYSDNGHRIFALESNGYHTKKTERQVFSTIDAAQEAIDKLCRERHM